MRGDFGTLVWVNDKEGHELVCTADEDFKNKKSYESLTEKERATCTDVNEFVGTERW